MENKNQTNAKCRFKKSLFVTATTISLGMNAFGGTPSIFAAECVIPTVDPNILEHSFEHSQERIQKQKEDFMNTFLLDYQGYPIEYGKYYYMNPYSYPHRGLAYEKYLLTHFILVQNNDQPSSSSGQLIKFNDDFGSSTDKYVKLNTPMSITAVSPPEGETQNFFTYSDSPLAHGLKLTGLPGAPHLPNNLQSWTPEGLPEDIPGLENASDLSNLFVLKNDFSKGYLSIPFANNEKLWLDARTQTVAKETLWRLIPKE